MTQCVDEKSVTRVDCIDILTWKKMDGGKGRRYTVNVFPLSEKRLNF